MKNRSPKTALIVGVTSDIGSALAEKLAQEGHQLQFAGRNLKGMEKKKQDIKRHFGIEAEIFLCDLLEEDCGVSLLEKMRILPNFIFCVVGMLGSQKRAQKDPVHAQLIMQTNYLGPCLLLEAFAEAFEKRGTGALVGISSVAGDRGKASNYIYGSAKAGLTTFLSGLRNRMALAGCQVHILTVQPGFVWTRVTKNMNLSKILTASPEEVAAGILRGIFYSSDVIYIRRIWFWIMLVIRLIPEFIFKRMNISNKDIEKGRTP